jgi:uncharacterized membrane protein
MPPSPDSGTLARCRRRESEDGAIGLTTSFLQAGRRFPSAVLGSGVVGGLATLGAVAAGAALLETALIPGLLIGGAAMLAPRLLPRDMLSGLGNGRRRTAPSPAISAPTVHATRSQQSGEHAPFDGSFDTWRAVAKTLTYRVMVTTADFGANYVVIGELATAAGLSSLSLVAGPIAYFAHEAAWHYYGPASARHANPLAATVDVPLPGAARDTDNGADNGRTHFPRIKVSRALAKTVTYEGVTGVSEFSVNYLFVRDFAAAAGLTTFSMVIAPIVYYVHEKIWDYYDAAKARPPGTFTQITTTLVPTFTRS